MTRDLQMRILKRPRTLIKTLALVTGLSVVATAQELTVDYLGAISDRLQAPTSLAISQDQLAVLEPFSNDLKVFTPNGLLLEEIYITGQALGLQRLSQSEYVYCDRGTRRVMRVDISSHILLTFAEPPVVVDPTDIVLNDSVVYVLDSRLRRICSFGLSGALLNTTPLPEPLDPAKSEFFSALAYNPEMDEYYVFEQVSSTIWRLDSSGSLLNVFAGFGSSDGDISRGGALAFDSRGMLYAIDRYQGVIATYTPIGIFLGYIELSDLTGDRLSNPSGLTVDADGTLYVTSTETNLIHLLKVTKPVDPASRLVAQQVFPPMNATVDPAFVSLTAELTLADRLLAGGDFTFALYSAADTVNALAEESVSGAPDTSSGITDGVIRGTWELTTELAGDTVYYWRVRYSVGADVGPWSDLRKFLISTLPQEYSLEQNYPNPFNPSTVISYALPQDSRVTLEVINILGQRVRTLVDERQTAGVKRVEWNGDNDDGHRTASGVYFYRLKAGSFTAVKKMILVK